MAKFTYEQFEAAQERKNNPQSSAPRNQVSYFGLKNDGDEAIVRFIYKNPSEFEFAGVHQVKVGNAFRRVNCLRTIREPIEKCPFCGCKDESISRVYSKFYVKLLEYVRDENGNIVAKARVWERPANFAKTLASYFAEYGDLSTLVFKVRRHGQARSMDTSYDVIPANPAVYKPEVYAPDFSAFENYSLSRYVVLEKTAEEMNTYLQTGEFPASAVEVKSQEEVTPEVTPTVREQAQPVQQEQPKQEERPVRRYTF